MKLNYRFGYQLTNEVSVISLLIKHQHRRDGLTFTSVYFFKKQKGRY